MQKLMMLAVLVAGLMLTFPRQSRATTLVVDQRVPACVAGDQVFTTLQDAVQFLAVTEGLGYPADEKRRIILVCPGTYSTGDDGADHRVGIGINALSIISTHGPHRTRIIGADASGFLINAHRVTIEGFTVVGGNIGIWVHRGDENKVLGNIVSDARTIGICVATHTNMVHGNHIDGAKDGIVISNASNHVCAVDPTHPDDNYDNVITNNTVKNNQRNADSAGILVEGGFHHMIVGNTVEDTNRGMVISPRADFTSVESNSVHDNDIGMVEQGSRTACDGNNIRDNTHDFQPQGACAPADNQLAYIRGQ